MTKLSILGNGCVRETALELKFLKSMLESGIERSKTLEESDYILYITCAGVGDTIYKCLKDIKCIFSQIKYNQLSAKLIIVGCLTNIDGVLDKLNNYDNVKIITKLDWNIPVLNYILEQNKKLSSKIKLENRTRYFSGSNASLQFFLEKGCINNCSFCKINYASMPVESVPYESAMDYLKLQIKNGTRCINLSGENLTLYGLDLYGKQVLHTFIKELSMEKELVNLSVNEITASNMYPELLEEMANNPKVKTVSMQLESASDRLLALMNRNHSMEEFDYIVRRLKENNKFVSTFLMGSFPTETYEDMDKTINYIKDRGIYVQGACQYVDFPCIPSSNLEQLNKKTKREHKKYMLKPLTENNYKVLTDFIPLMNSTVLIGRVDGYSVFVDAPNVIGISINKKYEDISIGSIVEDKPKHLIQKSKFNGAKAYRY